MPGMGNLYHQEFERIIPRRINLRKGSMYFTRKGIMPDFNTILIARQVVGVPDSFVYRQ
jgi:hypothetical protein